MTQPCPCPCSPFPLLSCSTRLAAIKPPATTHCLSLALPSQQLSAAAAAFAPVAAFPATLRLPMSLSLSLPISGHASLANLWAYIYIYSRMRCSSARHFEMLLLLLMLTAVAGYDGSINYWEAFAPGKLLQRLDALTLTGEQPRQASALSEQLPTAQAKLDVGELLDTDVEPDGDDYVELQTDSQSAEAHSGEDYERNYEQFVRQYFDRASDDAELDSAELQLDGSLETQAEASNVQHKQKPKDQRCRRVHRNGQLCKICREPRNNEVSETCSYSHEAEPERYAYGSGTQYKRYRDEPSEEQSDEQSETPSLKRKQRSEQPAGSSLCVRQLLGNSVCYECKDSGGQRLRRCYDAALTKHSSSSAKPGQPKTKQSEQSQRIYKRTISYSYAQGIGSQPDAVSTTTPAPVASLTTLTTLSPNRRRKLTKIVRRRAAVPNKNA